MGSEMCIRDRSKSELKLIEFCSPNTNKPLHLGHIRNILLGDSVSKIFNSCGYDVHKTQIINDRGIHICKSMIAWRLFGNGSTPKSEKIKGDKYVGEFKDNKMHGYGTLIRAPGTGFVFSGDKYIGQWKNGRRSGMGTITFPNGNRYVGQWIKGKKSGFGKLTISDGGIYIGEFLNNKEIFSETITSCGR